MVQSSQQAAVKVPAASSAQGGVEVVGTCQPAGTPLPPPRTQPTRALGAAAAGTLTCPVVQGEAPAIWGALSALVGAGVGMLVCLAVLEGPERSAVSIALAVGVAGMQDSAVLTKPQAHLA